MSVTINYIFMVAKKQGGLGRGLSAIFDIDTPAVTAAVEEAKDSNGLSSTMEIEISLIDPNPNQPRTNFDIESINELSQSIAVLGVIQPITVMKSDNGRFTIISGERRYRAAKLLNMPTIPVYIRTINDEALLEMALVENIQREDLNPLEIAISLDRLIKECSITQEVLSERIGKSRASISNYIRLLKLPAPILSALADGELTMGHAKALLSLDDEINIILVANKIMENGLSVRQAEQLAKDINSNTSMPEVERKATPVISGNFAKLQRTLKQIISGKVTVSETSKGERKVTITLKSDDDLNRLLHKLK